MGVTNLMQLCAWARMMWVDECVSNFVYLVYSGAGVCACVCVHARVCFSDVTCVYWLTNYRSLRAHPAAPLRSINAIGTNLPKRAIRSENGAATHSRYGTIPIDHIGVCSIHLIGVNIFDGFVTVPKHDLGSCGDALIDRVSITCLCILRESVLV